MPTTTMVVTGPADQRTVEDLLRTVAVLPDDHPLVEVLRAMANPNQKLLVLVSPLPMGVNPEDLKDCQEVVRMLVERLSVLPRQR